MAVRRAENAVLMLYRKQGANETASIELSSVALCFGHSELADARNILIEKLKSLSQENGSREMNVRL
jgi:hypothetical protein